MERATEDLSAITADVMKMASNARTYVLYDEETRMLFAVADDPVNPAETETLRQDFPFELSNPDGSTVKGTVVCVYPQGSYNQEYVRSRIADHLTK
jgi:hypothetical protein